MADTENRSLGAARFTTSAIGPNGRTIYFEDLVKDGEIVEVDGRRMVVTYDPKAPDWFVDECGGTGRKRIEVGPLEHGPEGEIYLEIRRV